MGKKWPLCSTFSAKASPFTMIRVRNFFAKFLEFCVYKVIASHPSKPKIRNMSPKFSELMKGGADLNHDKG